MGRQVQIYGKRVDVMEMCRKIEKVTRNDLIDIAQRILTGSEPTIVIQGDREAFGDVKGTLTKFGLGIDGKSFKSENKKKNWF
ncbi:unnamed protein product [[Candida] boidinii]|nr:unnamed protein product [[Candida] boidinii]